VYIGVFCSDVLDDFSFRIKVHCGLEGDSYLYIDSLRFSIIKRSIKNEHVVSRVGNMAREACTDELPVS